MGKRGRRIRLACLFGAALMCLMQAVPRGGVNAAGTETLTLEQANRLALANSKEYKRTMAKIEMQQVKYTAAVKSIRMKKKNMRTFRWTPLLSFKFPQQPALADAYEWQYKPLQITGQLDVLRHKLTDVTYSVREEVSLLYVQAYVCQEKIKYGEAQRKEAQATLDRNRMKLLAGSAAQADVDKMEATVTKITTELAAQMRIGVSLKSRLSKLLKLDVTVNYEFVNPFVEADVPRSALDSLVDYTLSNDQAFYETKMNTAAARISLDLNESLMKEQYGSKMNGIQLYVDQAKRGEEVDGYAFKVSYNDFLKKIDQPWDGSLRILFIRIPKEWFKGAISGSRYVEDDPYALYTSALEYADAYAEQEKAREQLESAVREGYDNIVTARNAYLEAVKASDKLKEEVGKATVRNQVGDFSYEELAQLQAEYAEYQMEELNLLAEYSMLLYSFDRLTCGAVSQYIEKGGLALDGANGGNSFVESDEIKGACYYIRPKIEDNIFLFGIRVPDGFPIEITAYELWVNGVQIGERRQADEELRHLALSFDNVESAKVYLYREEELVDICEIDPDVNQDELILKNNYRVEEEGRRTVASYACKENRTIGTAEITVTPQAGEPIASYLIEDREGRALYSQEPVPAGGTFTYLSALAADLGSVRVLFYDGAGQLLYEGRFDTLAGTIYVE